MLAAVIAGSIVVRFGVIEAILRFYYLAGERPERVVRHRLRLAGLDDDGRRGDRARLRRADLRGAPRGARRRAWRG